MINALVELDCLYLRGKPRFPSPYQAGIRYKREPQRGTREHEAWQTIPEIISNGHGDCEDLTAYLVAWLRVYKKGRAIPWFRKKGRKWHVMVKHADGSIEDPSRLLGMGRV
jgi:hypothetical protein